MIKPHSPHAVKKTKAHVKPDMRFFLAVCPLLHLRAFMCADVCLRLPFPFLRLLRHVPDVRGRSPTPSFNTRT